MKSFRIGWKSVREPEHYQSFPVSYKADQSAQLQMDICMTTRAPVVSTGFSVNLSITNGGRKNEKN